MHIGQKGGTIFIVMIVLAAVGAVFTGINQMIDSKQRDFNRRLAKEERRALEREFSDLINASGVCASSLKGDLIPANLSSSPPIPGDTGPDVHRFVIRSLDIDGSAMSAPFIDPASDQDYVSSNYKALRVEDVQLKAPSPFPSPAPEYLEAKIVLMVAEKLKGETKTKFPPIEKKVILQVTPSGGKLRIEDCGSANLPEFNAPNFVPDSFSVTGDGTRQIMGDNGEELFKLCVISGMDYEPDFANAISLFMQGDIARQTPMLCELYPEDASGNKIKPDEVQAPTKWFFRLDGSEGGFDSYINCEAICF